MPDFYRNDLLLRKAIMPKVMLLTETRTGGAREIECAKLIENYEKRAISRT